MSQIEVNFTWTKEGCRRGGVLKKVDSEERRERWRQNGTIMIDRGEPRFQYSGKALFLSWKGKKGNFKLDDGTQISERFGMKTGAVAEDLGWSGPRKRKTGAIIFSSERSQCKFGSELIQESLDWVAED